MEPLKSATLDVDALVAALEAEAQYERVWLPPEPWWDALLQDKANFASALHRHLARGTTWPRSETIDARKPGHVIRPIALMTPDVRVVYRAMASALVPPSERVDRSAERYAEFVMEPVRQAYDRRPGLRRVGDAKYSHIVATDFAAFYEYIDHAILRDELDLAGKDLSIVDGLTQFLREIEGRSFGIPQRSDPSDWISEFYAARVERSMVRDGFDIWRYTDDFRVGCASYAEALSAIESLSRAARDVGLVLNEKKTLTPSFLTYLSRNADVEVHDVSEEIDPTDVEAAVTSDYVPADDEQAVSEADDIFEQLWDPQSHERKPENAWDIRTLDADQHRAVRRGLNTLTKLGDSRALPVLLSILAYQPAMTHRVIRYAESVAATDAMSVENLLDTVVERLSVNEWQRAWIAYGFRACNIELKGDAARAEWLNGQLSSRPSSIAAAESAVTLAKAGLVSFDLLEGFLRTANDDFAPWYLHAVSLLHGAGYVTADKVKALRHSSAVAAAVLR